MTSPLNLPLKTVYDASLHRGILWAQAYVKAPLKYQLTPNSLDDFTSSLKSVEHLSAFREGLEIGLATSGRDLSNFPILLEQMLLHEYTLAKAFRLVSSFHEAANWHSFAKNWYTSSDVIRSSRLLQDDLAMKIFDSPKPVTLAGPYKLFNNIKKVPLTVDFVKHDTLIELKRNSSKTQYDYFNLKKEVHTIQHRFSLRQTEKNYEQTSLSFFETSLVAPFKNLLNVSLTNNNTKKVYIYEPVIFYEEVKELEVSSDLIPFVPSLIVDMKAIYSDSNSYQRKVLKDIQTKLDANKTETWPNNDDDYQI